MPWLAPDPTGVSQAITAWGRLPWTKDFLSSRELYLISLMAIGLVLPLAWSKGRRAWRTIGADFLWTTPISILLLVTWFITAPDVRFGWIALFAPVGMPLALLFAAKAFPELSLRVLGVAVLTLMAVANFLNGRIDPRGTPPQDRQIKFLSLTWTSNWDQRILPNWLRQLSPMEHPRLSDPKGLVTKNFHSAFSMGKVKMRLS